MSICYHGEELNFTALAAAWGSDAQLAVWQEGEVYLIDADPNHLVASAMSTTGAPGAGSGESVSIPTNSLVAADVKAEGSLPKFERSLEDYGVKLDTARKVADMFDGINARIEFGIQHRDNAGKQSERISLDVFDTHNGRYLQVEDSRGNSSWTTIVPASNSLVASRLNEKLGH